MFTGNWFATTHFPDPYFFGAGIDSGDLYVEWAKQGYPAHFMYDCMAYLAVYNPDVRFIKIERGANPDPADRRHIWDQYYGPLVR